MPTADCYKSQEGPRYGLSAATARLEGAPTNTLKFAATYISTLFLMLVIDGSWIALVALPMFRTTLGQDMLTARAVPAVLFHLVYAAGFRSSYWRQDKARGR
jgi:hypothetical protein